jgi:KDO2-lipid IV(A) lauroyltransferase
MIIKDTILRDVGRLFMWFPFRWFITLSPYRFVGSLSYFMGLIDHHFCKSRRIQLIKNLEDVFGNKINSKNIAKRIMQTHYLNLLELFKFSSINKTNIYNYVDIDGISNLDHAISKGTGVILATLHFGTMQYPLIALGVLGYAINQLGDRDTEAPEFSFIHRKIALKYRTIIENKFKAKHIHISKSLKRIYKCLEDHELLMINVDGVGGLKGQRLKRNYLKIQFMGNDVYVPSGAVRIARKTGTPIVPIVCIRQDNGKHKIIIDHPIVVKSSKDKNLDIQDYTQQLLSHFEHYIKTYPDHWLFWMEFKKEYMII